VDVVVAFVLLAVADDLDREPVGRAHARRAGVPTLVLEQAGDRADAVVVQREFPEPRADPRGPPSS